MLKDLRIGNYTHFNLISCYDVCLYLPQNKDCTESLGKISDSVNFGPSTCLAVQWFLTDKNY